MTITSTQTPAGTRYVLSYYCPVKRGNVRKRFKTEKEAQGFHKTVQKGQKHSIPARLVQAPPAVMHDIQQALELTKGTTVSLTEAVTHYLKHIEQRNAIRALDSFDRLLAAFKRNRIKSGVRQTTADSYDCALNCLNSLCAVDLGAASKSDLETALEAESINDTTRNTYLRNAKVFFGWLQAEGFRTDNPSADLKFVKVEKSDPCIYSLEQSRKLLETVAEHAPQFINAYAIGLFCGIRPDAVAKLTDGDIDLEHGTIKVGWTADKTRKKYFAEIPENLKAWLKFSDVKDQILNVPRYHRDRICALAGLKHGHDILRHTFASHHYAAHKSADKTAAALNHSNTDMLYRHYRAAVSPQDGQSFFKLQP